ASRNFRWWRWPRWPRCCSRWWATCSRACSSAMSAPRTPATSFPATAASSTASTASSRRCRCSPWPRPGSGSEMAAGDISDTATRRGAVLGATGSIGASALDVIARHPVRLQASVLAAGTRVEALLELCRTHRPRHAVIASQAHYPALRDGLRAAGLATEAHFGDEALQALVAGDACDTVVAAIVGAAGLPSTLAAARAGKRLLLANKESLVLAGELLTRAAREGGALVVPIDSEHNAIFQCLSTGDGRGETGDGGLRRIVLTASGGPFRGRSRDELAGVTPAQAVKHPKWSMGPKISVDSATLMNKGLEVIEAHHLFGLPGARIDVLVHPQSLVHSLVEFVDGSTLAQLGLPDMRTALAV